jgi:hypothetical protein
MTWDIKCLAEHWLLRLKPIEFIHVQQIEHMNELHRGGKTPLEIMHIFIADAILPPLPSKQAKNDMNKCGLSTCRVDDETCLSILDGGTRR